ncbi:MAG: DNA repair protein RecN [Legionellales bacterium]|nr:DNA repair protein RecN [Legionellales bacterium]
MLTSLRIKNFTIVAELELDFTEGMSVFTGETGAGKSIMIDALILALGDRADASVIRPGAEVCDIQACFSCDSESESSRWMAEHDLPLEDASIFMRRVVTREGRSKAYINGVAFPLQKVKELGVTLVHIHGQHEHQTLFNAATHRDQLDYFAQHGELRRQLAAQYQQCQTLQAQLAELATHVQQDNSELLDDLKTWQAAQPFEGEIEALHQEHQLLHHGEEYGLQTQTMLHLLQDEEDPTIQHNLHLILQTLGRLPQENRQVQAAQTLLEQAQILCHEAYDELETFGQALALDPQRLQTVETRMSTLHHLARKWKITVQQLPAYGQSLEEALQARQQTEERKEQLAEAYAAAQQAYQTLALQLRASRMDYAQHLAKQITTNIQQLGMPHGFIELAFSPLATMHVHGMDKIEYRVSTNPGMPADLLTKIASGGELSRISLAIQLIAAQQGSTPTLFFDEVDVGIGGVTAAMVGRLLRQLGQRLQVFCVTHQPQVAASAHQHFLVKKYTDHHQTFSQITALHSPAEKVEELARMLGGLSITPQTRSHAQELLVSLTSES